MAAKELPPPPHPPSEQAEHEKSHAAGFGDNAERGFHAAGEIGDLAGVQDTLIKGHLIHEADEVTIRSAGPLAAKEEAVVRGQGEGAVGADEGAIHVIVEHAGAVIEARGREGDREVMPSVQVHLIGSPQIHIGIRIVLEGQGSAAGCGPGIQFVFTPEAITHTDVEERIVGGRGLPIVKHGHGPTAVVEVVAEAAGGDTVTTALVGAIGGEGDVGPAARIGGGGGEDG